MSKSKKKKGKSAEKSENAPVKQKRSKKIKLDTKISDVTQYAIELYFKERALGKMTKERKQELKDLHKKIGEVFSELGLKCYKCDAAVAETFREGALIHPFDAREVVSALNEKLHLDLTALDFPEMLPNSEKA